MDTDLLRQSWINDAMVRSGSGRGGSAERRSSIAFFVAGVVWLGDTLLLGLELFRLFPSGLLNSGLVLTGLICSLLGLICLFRRLADQAPRLALASTGVAVAGGAAIVVQIVWGTVAMLVTAISSPPGITTLLLGLLALGGFVAFGITSLYTGIPSRLIGVLFFTYAIAFVGAAVSTGWVQFGLVGVLSGVSIALGYLLYAAAPSTCSNSSAASTA